MDGLVIVSTAGQAVIQSQFRHAALERGITPTFVVDLVKTRLGEVRQTGHPMVALDPEEDGKTGLGPILVGYLPNRDAVTCLVLQRKDLIYLAPCSGTRNPMAVMTFLQDFVAILAAYLAPRPCTEVTVKDHFDLVYLLLAEMLDEGHVIETELNGLEQVVKRNDFELWAGVRTGLEMAGLSSQVSTKGKQAPSLPWRRPNVRYTNNEIFFDSIEEMDVLMEKDGRVLTLDIWLSLTGSCKLSNMPDLLLQFARSQTSLIQDVEFHPCVRTGRWGKDKVLSFVPPDGTFELLRARLGQPNEWAMTRGGTGIIPIEVRPDLDVHDRGGSFSVSLKAAFKEAPLEDVVVHFELGLGISSCSCTLTPSSVGDWTFDPKRGVLQLKIPRLTAERGQVKMRGTFSMSSKCRDPPQPSFAAQVDFTVLRYSFINLKIDSLKVVNESYKPYKGIKQIAQAGRFEIRL